MRHSSPGTRNEEVSFSQSNWKVARCEREVSRDVVQSKCHIKGKVEYAPPILRKNSADGTGLDDIEGGHAKTTLNI